MNNPNAAKNLKPWAKGQSGNPGGVGKDVAHMIGLAKENSQAAIETLASIMRDRKQAGHVRVSAANSILDRAYGKPKERVEAVVKQSLEDLVLASYRRSETIEHLPTGEAIEKVKTVAAVAQPSIAELVERSYRSSDAPPSEVALQPQFIDSPPRSEPGALRIGPGQSLDSFMAEVRASERQPPRPAPQFDRDLQREARERWLSEQFSDDPNRPRHPGL